MTVRGFTDERKARWDELRALLEQAERRRGAASGDALRRLGSLYRSTAADLALARRLYPGDPVVAHLDSLVRHGRTAVYSASSRRTSLVRFFVTDYWRLVAAKPLALVVSAACLFGPMALAAAWALSDPAASAGIVPPGYRSVTEPRSSTDIGLSLDTAAAISAEIFTNNIRVTLLAFAAGVLLGVGTALLLAFNGVLIGALAGLSYGAGNGRPFAELVLAHGVLELSCIVVAGAAGLRLGWAIVEPGTLTRRASLTREARTAIQIALGTAPWLVLAGLVEGFVTGSGISFVGVLVVGFSLGALYWALVLWRGRPARCAPGAAGTTSAPATWPPGRP
jgi:uncharacterized membrane protein SpoIIM required for sporulation